MKNLIRHIILLGALLISISGYSQSVKYGTEPAGGSSGSGTTNTVTRQALEPTGAIEADVWERTTDNVWHVYDDGAWVAQLGGSGTVNNVTLTAIAPTAIEGDIYKNPTTGISYARDETTGQWIVIGQDPALIPEFDDPLSAQTAGLTIGMTWKTSELNTMGAAYGTSIIKSKIW